MWGREGRVRGGRGRNRPLREVPSITRSKKTGSVLLPVWNRFSLVLSMLRWNFGRSCPGLPGLSCWFVWSTIYPSSVTI